MARTSQAEASNTGATAAVQQAGVWVQYKGTRARTLQTTKDHDVQAGLRTHIINGFLADLEALKLTLHGLPMVDIRIVWGTGQVRADYDLKKGGLRFNVVIRYLVKRASTEYLDQMSERSIARLCYVEDGSTVEIRKLPLGRPPLLPSLRPPRALLSTGSSDKVLNVPSSSQPLSAPPSGIFSLSAPSAQPSLASRAQPPADRLQAFPSALQTLPCATEFRAHQAPPFQSPYPPAPSISHQNGFGPSPHPTAVQLQSSNEQGGGRDPRSYVNAGETNHIAGPSTALGPHQSPYGALASPTIPLAPPDSTRLYRPIVISPVSLTRDACSRLKDPADDAVLAIFPVVRILVLRSTQPRNDGAVTKSYEAFVTDGRDYMWLAFVPSVAEKFGDLDDEKSLQVGSAVRLKRVSRLLSARICPILVHDIEIIDSTSDARSAVAIDNHPPDSVIRPEVARSSATGLTTNIFTQAFDGHPAGVTLVHNERAALLLADAKFQEERRRRVLLERVLEDVCGDLHRLDSLYPAAAEVLRRIDKLTEAATISD